MAIDECCINGDCGYCPAKDGCPKASDPSPLDVAMGANDMTPIQDGGLIETGCQRCEYGGVIATTEGPIPCPVCTEDVKRDVEVRGEVPPRAGDPFGRLTLEELAQADREERAGVPGTKFDTGKLPVELVPVEAVEAVARVMDFGRKKYTENGWQSVPNGERRYFAAAYRHILAVQKTMPDLDVALADPDSGLPHLEHCLCNLAFLMYLMARR
jgi:hypothetical protein